MDEFHLHALASDEGFVLKSEQKEIVKSLHKGRNLFDKLSTGFGKSLIFQPNAVTLPTIIVIFPPKSSM